MRSLCRNGSVGRVIPPSPNRSAPILLSDSNNLPGCAARSPPSIPASGVAAPNKSTKRFASSTCATSLSSPRACCSALTSRSWMCRARTPGALSSFSSCVSSTRFSRSRIASARSRVMSASYRPGISSSPIGFSDAETVVDPHRRGYRTISIRSPLESLGGSAGSLVSVPA